MDMETTQEPAKKSASNWRRSEVCEQRYQSERHRLIATAAYLRAEQRGFVGGDPVADWLAAEAEVDQMLAGQKRDQDRELDAFDKLYREVQRALGDIKDKVSSDAIKDAIENPSAAVRRAGDYTAEMVNRVTDAVKKDLASTAERLAPKWETITNEGAGLFETWCGRGSVFLGRAAQATADWLKEVGTQLQHPNYQAGEMTGAGTFECTGCGERQVLTEPARLRLCAKCQGREFRRS